MEVARYFLWLACNQGDELISNMKLQKLMYYAQGYHLAKYDSPLFDGVIEAWDHGPAVREVYGAYKDHGRQGIPCPDGFRISGYSESEQELMNDVFSEFGQFSANALRNMTHDDPIWRKVGIGEVISIALMKDQFKARASVRNVIVVADRRSWNEIADELLERKHELWRKLAEA
jgi:uncharacterized phage-associated protein